MILFFFRNLNKKEKGKKKHSQVVEKRYVFLTFFLKIHPSKKMILHV